jgi:hypothetical protein
VWEPSGRARRTDRDPDPHGYRALGVPGAGLIRPVDAHDRIARSATEYRHRLRKTILPYWLEISRDDTYGGYLVADDFQRSRARRVARRVLRRQEGATPYKHLVAHARLVWVFSFAHRKGYDTSGEFLTAAERGYRFLLDHFQMQDIITVAADRRTAKGRFRGLLMGGTHETRPYKPEGLPLQFYEAGIYENDYVRADGVWKIKRLDYMMQWQADYDLGWSKTTAHLQPATSTYPENPLGPDVILPAARVRRAGGGRKKLTQTDPTLLADLQELVAAATRGDPQAPLLWTSRSLRNLAAALQAMGHRISHHAVADLLRELNYNLQSQDTRRSPQPRPRCAICLYQCKSCGGISRRRAGHLRRYQEKGTGRRLQERRPRTAPQRRTRTGARS